MDLKRIEQNGFRLIAQTDETFHTVVWTANQTMLDRTVSLSILKPEAVRDRVVREHFLSMARLFSKIKSESITSVFDIVSEGDLHYVVMEYVEGPTLDSLVSAAAPFPLTNVLQVATLIATSFQQMWDPFRIVHRNLKSAALRMDPRGVAKLADFSLAIVAGPDVDVHALDGGHIVGTPCFLSPEQAQGSRLLTTQSDMYAFGIVLYHLSTGRVPFMEHDPMTILRCQVQDQVPPPHLLNPKLPVTFSWFVHRLLMKNPHNRYESWPFVLSDLKALAENRMPVRCVMPDETYLSTIAFEPLVTDTVESDEPEQARKVTRLKAVSQKISRLEDEHRQEIAAEDRRKRWGAILMMATWFILLFWYRGMYQPVTPLRAPMPEQTQELAVSEPVSSATERPRDEAGPKAATLSAMPLPTQPEPRPDMPEQLEKELIQAFRAGDTAQALASLRRNTTVFQNEEALIALLLQTRTPTEAVEDFFKRRIGRPLSLERNGKQRIVIPRGVANGVLTVEANERSVDIAISEFTAEERLNLLDRPTTEAEWLTHCLMLLQSKRKEELPGCAEKCPVAKPLLLKAVKS